MSARLPLPPSSTETLLTRASGLVTSWTGQRTIATPPDTLDGDTLDGHTLDTLDETQEHTGAFETEPVDAVGEHRAFGAGFDDVTTASVDDDEDDDDALHETLLQTAAAEMVRPVAIGSTVAQRAADPLPVELLPLGGVPALTPSWRARRLKLSLAAFGAIAVVGVAIGVFPSRPSAPAPDVATAGDPGAGAAFGSLASAASGAPETPDAEPEVAPVTAERVVLEVRSEPRGADVYLAGRFLGATPLVTTVPREQRAQKLRVSLDGYPVTETKIIATSSQAFRIVFATEAAEPELATPAAPTPPPRRVRSRPRRRAQLRAPRPAVSPTPPPPEPPPASRRRLRSDGILVPDFD